MTQFATLPDGAMLAYDLYDFTDPWRAAETLVLVHGFSKNRKFWFEWIPHLARHYRVITIDQRGHGDSAPLPRDFKVTLAPFAADLAHFLDALGLAAAHIVAAEFSSKIGIEFAVLHPERVKTLIMPGLIIGGTEASLAWADLAEREGSAEWARQTVGARLPADADPAMRDWYMAEQSRVPGWFLATLFRTTPYLNSMDRLPLVRAPTLILAGAEAKQADPEMTRATARAIPDCKLVEFPGMPLNVMSACPTDCVRETLTFLGARGF